jgi:hypothetical protein
LSDGHP